MKIKNRKVKRGFTLIELVMVVGILGILSSIALVKFTDVQGNAKINADYVAASNIANAAQLAKEAGVAVTSPESLKADGYLEGVSTPQSIKGDFSIVKADDGSFKIMVGDEQFYPKPVGE
jgi:type IV pilus assembly protein PilA